MTFSTVAPWASMHESVGGVVRSDASPAAASAGSIGLFVSAESARSAGLAGLSAASAAPSCSVPCGTPVPCVAISALEDEALSVLVQARDATRSTTSPGTSRSVVLASCRSTDVSPSVANASDDSMLVNTGSPRAIATWAKPLTLLSVTDCAEMAYRAALSWGTHAVRSIDDVTCSPTVMSRAAT